MICNISVPQLLHTLETFKSQRTYFLKIFKFYFFRKIIFKKVSSEQMIVLKKFEIVSQEKMDQIGGVLRSLLKTLKKLV